MSRENPRSPEWAEYYAKHPEVLASWRESNGRQPYSERLCDICKGRDNVHTPAVYQARAINGAWGFFCGLHFRTTAVVETGRKLEEL